MPARPATSDRRATAVLVRRGIVNIAVLGETLVVLTIASLAIRWLPFRHVMALAGWRGFGTASGDCAARARRIAWAVRRWSAVLPWRTVCFQRGLAAHWLMRRRGIPSVLHYGIANRGEAGISAHVWVVLHGHTLVGGEDADRHACVMVRPDSAKPRTVTD